MGTGNLPAYPDHLLRVGGMAFGPCHADKRVGTRSLARVKNSSTHSNELRLNCRGKNKQARTKVQVDTYEKDETPQKPIDKINIKIRDQVKMEYLIRAFYQPIGYKFTQKRA